MSITLHHSVYSLNLQCPMSKTFASPLSHPVVYSYTSHYYNPKGSISNSALTNWKMVQKKESSSPKWYLHLTWSSRSSAAFKSSLASLWYPCTLPSAPWTSCQASLTGRDYLTCLKSTKQPPQQAVRMLLFHPGFLHNLTARKYTLRTFYNFSL